MTKVLFLSLWIWTNACVAVQSGGGHFWMIRANLRMNPSTQKAALRTGEKRRPWAVGLLVRN
jgi:hypothetical protein